MFQWISDLFKPAADLVDNLHTSDEEKAELRNKMLEIQGKVHGQVTDLMKAEVSSDNWLVSSWRPITTVLLIIAVLLDGHFGVNLDDKVYGLLELFLSVYAGGRSLEKITREAKKKK